MTRLQATVRDWDAELGGTALTDQGTTLRIPAEALRGSVFRLLRPGQRVALELDGDQVVGVDLV